MRIETKMKDKNGIELNIGDTINLYDWGGSHSKIGTCVIVFDESEGRVSTEPCLIEDAYDFWSKALPRSEKVVA